VNVSRRFPCRLASCSANRPNATRRVLVGSNQELRSGSDPLQSWQCELSALENEAPLALPPGASLCKPFAFHNQIGDEA